MEVQVGAGDYKVGDIIFGKKIKSFGKTWTAKVLPANFLGGQMWEECEACGREPVYQPSMKCEHCISQAFGKDAEVCYAYLEE